MSSGVSGSGARTSIVTGAFSSGAVPKILSKSVRKAEKTGAGMLSVGENTIPTLRTFILLTSEFLTTSIRNLQSALSKVQFGSGSL